jgi:hypothetical protein
MQLDALSEMCASGRLLPLLPSDLIRELPAPASEHGTTVSTSLRDMLRAHAS